MMVIKLFDINHGTGLVQERPLWPWRLCVVGSECFADTSTAWFVDLVSPQYATSTSLKHDLLRVHAR
jgi:hypothetical protein